MRDKLRLLIEKGREMEASDLLPHVDDSPPSQPGRWTAKDNLAHLTAWRLIAVAEMNAVRTGGAAPAVSSEDDVQNAKIYEETHHLSASSVLESGRRSWDEFAAAVEACSDEVLLMQRTRRPEQRLWSMVPNHTYFHIGQHLGWWHTEQGEDGAAEEAARWAHGLATTTFTDDRVTGFAHYNLGCFYASRGRAQDALPYLRKGIELVPSLRDVARQDTELDPIRSTPELAGLLA